MGKKIIVTERQLKKIVEDHIPDFLGDDHGGVEYDDYDDSMERNMGIEDDFNDEEEDYESILKRVVSNKRDEKNKLPGL